MNQTASLPPYQSLYELLRQPPPAEFHGLLCGMLCADPGLTRAGWLKAISREIRDLDADNAVLQQLYQATHIQIDSDSLDFHLLLPDDDQALGERALALGDWCQGFLSGLGLGGLSATAELPGEADEFIQDVSQIAQLGLDAGDDEESDETAYAEIVEYLRVGVLLLRQTLDPSPALPGQRLH